MRAVAVQEIEGEYWELVMSRAITGHTYGPSGLDWNYGDALAESHPAGTGA
jgi:hypothetical protein